MQQSVAEYQQRGQQATQQQYLAMLQNAALSKGPLNTNAFEALLGQLGKGLLS